MSYLLQPLRETIVERDNQESHVYRCKVTGRCYKIYRRLSKGDLRDYADLQNSLGNFSIDIDEGFKLMGEYVNKIHVEILEIPREVTDVCHNPFGKSNFSMTEPIFVPGDNFYNLIIREGIDSKKLTLLFNLVKGYFLRVCTDKNVAGTNLVQENVKLVGIKGGILTVVVTDIATNITFLLEENDYLQECLQRYAGDTQHVMASKK